MPSTDPLPRPDCPISRWRESHDCDFEERVYVTAPPQTRAWLKANRGMIRALLQTDEARRILASTVVVMPDGSRSRLKPIV